MRLRCLAETTFQLGTSVPSMRKGGRRRRCEEVSTQMLAIGTDRDETSKLPSPSRRSTRRTTSYTLVS